MYINTNIKGLGIETVEGVLKELRPDLQYEYLKRGIRIDMRPVEERQSSIIVVSDGNARVKLFTWKGDIHLKAYPKAGGFFSLFSGFGQLTSNRNLENELAEMLAKHYQAECIRVGIMR